MNNEIERIFISDVIDKKKTARGIHCRASRRGYIRGGVRTQSDFLSNKEKKKLSGEVRSYNMYSDLKNIPNLDDLKKIIKTDPDKARVILEESKKNFSQSVLRKHWQGVSVGWLYYQYEKLGIEINKKVYKPREKKTTNSSSDSSATRTTFANLLDNYNITEEEIDYIRVINTIDGNIDKLKRNPNYIRHMSKLSGKYFNAELQIILDATDKQIKNAIYRLGLKGKRTTPTKSQLLKEIEEYRNRVGNKKTKQDKPEMKQEALQLDLKEDGGVNLNQDKKLIQSLQEQLQQLQEMVNKKEESQNNIGFTVKFSGEYSKTDLENRLLNIASIMLEDKTYKVNVSLEEI